MKLGKQRRACGDGKWGVFYQNKFSVKMQYFVITSRAIGNVGKWMWMVRPQGSAGAEGAG